MFDCFVAHQKEGELNRLSRTVDKTIFAQTYNSLHLFHKGFQDVELFFHFCFNGFKIRLKLSWLAGGGLRTGYLLNEEGFVSFERPAIRAAENL